MNSVEQAGKGFAKGMFIIGLLLVGFAMLVWVLKEIFAFIAAGIFILAGVWCCGFSIKVWWHTRKFKAGPNGDENSYRENVRIHHSEENFEQ